MLTGGKQPPALSQGFFVEPTIFTDVSPDMTVWREEVSSFTRPCPSIAVGLHETLGTWVCTGTEGCRCR